MSFKPQMFDAFSLCTPPVCVHRTCSLTLAQHFCLDIVVGPVNSALSKLFFDAFVSSSRNGDEADGLIETDKMSEALNPPLDYLYAIPPSTPARACLLACFVASGREAHFCLLSVLLSMIDTARFIHIVSGSCGALLLRVSVYSPGVVQHPWLPAHQIHNFLRYYFETQVQ